MRKRFSYNWDGLVTIKERPFSVTLKSASRGKILSRFLASGKCLRLNMCSLLNLIFEGIDGEINYTYAISVMEMLTTEIK